MIKQMIAIAKLIKKSIPLYSKQIIWVKIYKTKSGNN